MKKAEKMWLFASICAVMTCGCAPLAETKTVPLSRLGTVREWDAISGTSVGDGSPRLAQLMHLSTGESTRRTTSDVSCFIDLMTKARRTGYSAQGDFGGEYEAPVIPIVNARDTCTSSVAAGVATTSCKSIKTGKVIDEREAPVIPIVTARDTCTSSVAAGVATTSCKSIKTGKVIDEREAPVIPIVTARDTCTSSVAAGVATTSCKSIKTGKVIDEREAPVIPIVTARDTCTSSVAAGAATTSCKSIKTGKVIDEREAPVIPIVIDAWDS